MKFSRRQLLHRGLRAGALATLPLPAAAAPAAPRLGFFVIGDWGRDGAHHQTAVARAMATASTARRPRFIVSAGDNFYESGVTGIDDPQWQTSFEQVYAEPSLQKPWHVILGNHDYRGNVPAQLAYTHISPRWRLPARYYSRIEAVGDGTTAELFFLDTSPFIRAYRGTITRIEGQNPHAQRAWLDAALGRSTARWKIVIGHHPIYTALTGPDHDQPDLIAALDPLLRRHRVPVYINGHDHSMQYVAMNGIAYATSGTGSETYRPGPPRRAGFVSGTHGFLACAFAAEGLRLDFIDDHGRTRFARTVAGA